jgi:hypothetical protein
MSILSFPRLNFKGVFSTNPCTCNNDDVMPDIVNRDSDSLGQNTIFQQSDTNVQQYLNEMVSLDNYGSTSPTPTEFIRSGWNLYGNHATFFENTTITSAIVGPSVSQRMNQPSQDPIIGQAFRILGSPTEDPSRRGTPMIVDLDSTGLITTQLYIGGIEFGDSQSPITTINADTRAYQDWLNFNSTIGPYGGEQNFVGIGCIMQFVIPPEALPSATTNSSTLNALLTAGQQNNGLVIRFRIFECEPQLTDEMLNYQFGQGNQVHNPGLAYLVGTVSVQLSGDAVSEPAGLGLRKLSAPYPRPAMYFKGNPQNPNPSPSGMIPPAPMPYAGAPALIGNMVASFFVPVGSTIGYVSLDIINCFPKDGFRHPDGPNGSDDGFDVPCYMADVGDIELVFNPQNTSQIIPICDIDYAKSNYSNYEDYGGIVDIPFDATLLNGIQAGNLWLRGKASSALNANTFMLSEEVVRIVTDDRAVYLEQDPKSSYSKYSIGIKLFFRGGPIPTNTTLYLKEYVNIIQVQEPTPDMGYRPNQTVDTENPPDKLIFPSTVVVPAGQGYSDWFQIPIQTSEAGAVVLHYTLNPSWDAGYKPSVPAWTTECYSSIRIFQAAPSSIPTLITWDYVYQNILRFYYLIYPFMSSVIPLNQPDSIQNPFWSQKILDRLNTLEDGAKFYATTNMPVTRTMPPWKVNVLKQFINQPLK